MSSIFYKKSGIIKFLSIALAYALFLCGCGTDAPVNKAEAAEESVTETEEMQAVDTAVVINVNTEEKSIILQTAENQKRYELSYDGKTEFRNKYGDAMTAAQIKPASIVDVVLSVHSQTLKSMQLAQSAFSMGEVADHKFNMNKGMLTVGDENYRVNDKLVVVMDGQVGTVADIIENDVLTINGIGKNAMSATIDKGHGYMRLRGESAFLGGWVQVDQIIKPITEKMLVLIPEGDHEVHISYHGFGGGKPIHIERDKETVVDVSDLEDEILKTGEVTFDVDPGFARIKVDGEEVNNLIPTKLLYGVHKIQALARGYVPIEKYLSVGSESATVQITLQEAEDSEESEDEDDENTIDYVNPGKDDLSSSAKNASENKTGSSSRGSSKKASSSSSGQGSSSSSSSNKEKTGRICIDDPDDAEIYFDGTYKGLSPIRFEKEEGTHVITLRRDGYITKSYTVEISDSVKDEHYSFDELIRDEDNDDNEEEIVGIEDNDNEADEAINDEDSSDYQEEDSFIEEDEKKTEDAQDAQGDDSDGGIDVFFGEDEDEEKLIE